MGRGFKMFRLDKCTNCKHDMEEDEVYIVEDGWGYNISLCHKCFIEYMEGH